MKCKEIIKDGANFRGKKCGREAFEVTVGICKHHAAVKARREARTKRDQDSYIQSTILYEEAKKLSVAFGVRVRPEWDEKHSRCTGNFVLPGEFMKRLSDFLSGVGLGANDAKR